MASNKINGDDLLVYADGVLVGHSIDATISFTQDTPDATTKDSAQWNDHIKGNRGYELSGSGLLAFDSAMNGVEMIDFILNATTVTFRFSNGVATDIEYRGSVSVTAASISAPQNAPAGYDFSWLGKGAPTKVTIT